jgi:phenylacetate-CoA ligase
VPYYRRTWAGLYQPGEPLTPGRFGRLPVFARGELQAGFDDLKSAAVPSQHGAVTEVRTSGSTGQPVRLLKTSLTDLIWQAILLREHHWFGRDLQAKVAAIRQGVTEDEADGWGPEATVFRTGRLATLGIRADVDAQLAWLERQQPECLLTYPSNADALARAALARGSRLPKLREIRTFGELLGPDTRALCREAWGAPVTDSYSSVESGYIALQCPRHEHYHVQSESVLLEILDEQGGACAPGKMGRVVVTTLHNFALPLVRYDTGDFAEVGAPCPCGRGLPVLNRIVGRARNMLVTASGAQYWPRFGSRRFREIAPVRQFQFVQKTFDTIEARFVAEAPLTADQEERLRGDILAQLPAGLRLTFSYVGEIARSTGGKFEDFVSEVGSRRV